MFQVGDKVKIVCSRSVYCGCEGTVVCVSGDDVRVALIQEQRLLRFIARDACRILHIL